MDLENIVRTEFQKRNLKIDVVYKICNLYVEGRDINTLPVNNLIEIISDIKIICMKHEYYSKLQNEMFNCKNKQEFKNIMKSNESYGELYKIVYNHFETSEYKQHVKTGVTLLAKFTQ